jgi:hypothetical protein
MLFLVNCPCFYLWFIPLPFAHINRSCYLLGDTSSYAFGANIHLLSSLVSYQLFSPCCLTHPKDILQIKLHIYIDDSQHQPLRLIQYVQYSSEELPYAQFAYWTPRAMVDILYIHRTVWAIYCIMYRIEPYLHTFVSKLSHGVTVATVATNSG